jgi:hypothetical protein
MKKANIENLGQDDNPKRCGSFTDALQANEPKFWRSSSM